MRWGNRAVSVVVTCEPKLPWGVAFKNSQKRPQHHSCTAIGADPLQARLSHHGKEHRHRSSSSSSIALQIEMKDFFCAHGA